MSALRRHGQEGQRESGAFLLGQQLEARPRVIDFILYDDLDPHCLDTGIVRFDGRYFGDLWNICRQRGCAVVGDVHTHPGSSRQSESDRQNPMITRSGHIALIVPRFASQPVRLGEIGMYRYQGQKQWWSVPVSQRRQFLHVGI